MKLAKISRSREDKGRVIDAYLLRQADVIRPTSSVTKGKASVEQLATLFADYGRAMSPDLLALSYEMTPEQRGQFFVSAGETLTEAFGTIFKTSAMYRAFPNHDDVLIDKPMIDFLLSLGIHRLEDTTPDQFGANPITGEQNEEFGPSDEDDSQFATEIRWKKKKVFKVIDLADDEAVRKLALSSLNRVAPFTPDEAEFISACVDEGHIIPEDIAGVRFREKLPALVGMVDEEAYNESAISVTDGLRLAAHFSGGDVSLATSTRFRLNKSAGKRVLRLVEGVLSSDMGSPDDDFLRHEEAWKRLVRHIGTKRVNQHAPMLSMMVQSIRNGDVRSWNSKVQNSRLYESLNTLSQRPGSFVRSAVMMSRRFDKESGDRGLFLEAAVEAFGKAPAMPLFQLRTVLSRTVNHEDRFHVKKNGQILHSERPREDHADLLEALEYVMRERFSGTLPWSGAENAEGRFVPSGSRTASVSDGSVRGDSIGLNDDDPKVIRLFLHWKDASDVDLSAIFIDKNGDKYADCSYYSMTVTSRFSNAAKIAKHSGDIVDGRKGAAEYIDVNLAEARKNNIKHIVMIANVYSGKPFSDFPSHAGVMSRDGVTGKHFEASTIEASMRLTSSSTMCTCAMFDVDTMRLTYVDMPASWAQRMNATSGHGTVNKHAKFLENYGDYRVSMKDLLDIAGTPGGPVMTDHELVRSRGEIITMLSNPSQNKDHEPDSFDM